MTASNPAGVEPQRAARLLREAERLRNFPTYPLADVPQLKRELIASGVDVIDLGAGDADLAPPPAAVDALREAAGRPAMSRYPFQLGLPSFREAVAAWMGRRFGVALDPMREILPLIGSKEGIAHVAFCYVGRGDATILPDPGYAPYLGESGVGHAQDNLVAIPVRHPVHHQRKDKRDDHPALAAKKAAHRNHQHCEQRQ
jgi:LL-diaminopimelate aminotransferase